MNELKNLSNRICTYHQIIDANSAYLRSNDRCAGRFLAWHLGTGYNEHLDRLHYNEEAVNYLLENYQIRDADEIIAEHKSFGINWEKIEKDVYQFANFTITVKHCDNRLALKIPCGVAFFIEEFYSRNIEDLFAFVNLHVQMNQNKNMEKQHV